MHLKITTLVDSSLSAVKTGFTQELFMALNPPFPKVKLLRFDGCRQGDLVSLELNMIFFKQIWTSEITKDQETEKEWVFVDEGKKLPFFLKRWKHRHIVQSKGQQSRIIDDIHYSTGTWLTDVLLYPVLWGQFLYRKPVYRRVFNS